MTENLLHAPERGAIEAFLRRLDPEYGKPPTYERLLGFLSGVVITPGRFMPSAWMQPLLDLNGIAFDDIDDANRFMGALMPLYIRHRCRDHRRILPATLERRVLPGLTGTGSGPIPPTAPRRPAR